MVEPINLNKFRKQRAKSEKEQRAAENRTKFGQTKAARMKAKSETDKMKRVTDDHRLTPKDEA